MDDNPSLSHIPSPALFHPLGSTLVALELQGTNLTDLPLGVFNNTELPLLVNLTVVAPPSCPVGTVRVHTLPAANQTYCASGSGIACNGTTCACPAGYTQPAKPGQGGACDLCAPGTTQPLAGQGHCDQCVAGTFASAYGSTANSSKCQTCGSADLYCPRGSAAGLPVQRGYYSGPESQPAWARWQQLPCPTGSYCMYDGGVLRLTHNLDSHTCCFVGFRQPRRAAPLSPRHLWGR